MLGNLIRSKLRNGERVYGTHIASLENPVVMNMNCNIDMDFMFICTEHMPLNPSQVSMMCQYYSLRGISPVVRIPYPVAHHAGMAIDWGAQGIVAPYVETERQVMDLIGAVRYRPIKGKFLDDIIEGRRKPKAKLESFFTDFNRNSFLIIGIESVHAIDNLEKLLSFDEVDGVFLGPHDITCSMEIPMEYNNPLYIEMINKVVKTCRKMNRGVGVHSVYMSPVNQGFIDEGVNFILNASGIVRKTEVLNDDFKRLREKYDDEYYREETTRIDTGGCTDKI